MTADEEITRKNEQMEQIIREVKIACIALTNAITGLTNAMFGAEYYLRLLSLKKLEEEEECG